MLPYMARLPMEHFCWHVSPQCTYVCQPKPLCPTGVSASWVSIVDPGPQQMLVDYCHAPDQVRCGCHEASSSGRWQHIATSSAYCCRRGQCAEPTLSASCAGTVCLTLCIGCNRGCDKLDVHVASCQDNFCAFLASDALMRSLPSIGTRRAHPRDFQPGHQCGQILYSPHRNAAFQSHGRAIHCV